MKRGNFTVQNNDGSRVLVGKGDPTIIIVLNGKISFGAHMAIEAIENFMSCVAGTPENCDTIITTYPTNIIK
jgi:hypothetical protein